MPRIKGDIAIPPNNDSSDTPVQCHRTVSSQQRSSVESPHSSDRRRETSYGNTNVSGRARVVLGDVFHQHNYYNKDSSLSCIGENHRPIALNQGVTSQSTTLKRMWTHMLISQVTALDEESLLEMISSYDAAHAHMLRYAQHTPGTCQWVKDHRSYKTWLSGESPRSWSASVQVSLSWIRTGI